MILIDVNMVKIYKDNVDYSSTIDPYNYKTMPLPSLVPHYKCQLGSAYFKGKYFLNLKYINKIKKRLFR